LSYTRIPAGMIGEPNGDARGWPRRPGMTKP